MFKIDRSITYQPKLTVILLGDKCPRGPLSTSCRDTCQVGKKLERDFHISKHFRYLIITILVLMSPYFMFLKVNYKTTSLIDILRGIEKPDYFTGIVLQASFHFFNTFVYT